MDLFVLDDAFRCGFGCQVLGKDLIVTDLQREVGITIGLRLSWFERAQVVA